MFQIEVKLEAGKSVEVFDVTRPNAQGVEEFRQWLRRNAPVGGSIAEFKVTEVR